MCARSSQATMPWMRRREALLSDRLADARGREVVFVSHCLLDENARYLGGAFHRGAVPEMIELLRSGVGVHQMPCPERRAWGGVLKPQMLRAYGLRDSPLYPLRGVLFRLFVWRTRLVYRGLARRVAHDIEDYSRSGVRVLGVIGVGASPSCGVTMTLDLRRSFETIAACPLAGIDRTDLNERAIVGCRAPGEGLFTRALKRRLARRGLDVPFVEYDLVAEMRGMPQPESLAGLLSPGAGSARSPRATVGDY
jgi:uncharacterized protein YbbK (DUF523 family)